MTDRVEPAQQRKYSVGEIDRMRKALERICIRPMVPYNPVEKQREIEEHLRTYMLNGTDPEELEEQMYALWRKL